VHVVSILIWMWFNF